MGRSRGRGDTGHIHTSASGYGGAGAPLRAPNLGTGGTSTLSLVFSSSLCACTIPTTRQLPHPPALHLLPTTPHPSLPLVHPQGDGTAFIFRDRPDVFTLSVHAASNFPARKQRSTLDIALPDGTPDAVYLARVAEILPAVLRDFKPDLVLYDAGVDPHVDDALGRLALTDAGLARRERLVLDTCLGWGVPVAGYVGGGYDDDLDLLARRHLHLHRAAAELWRGYGLGGGGLGGAAGESGEGGVGEGHQREGRGER